MIYDFQSTRDFLQSEFDQRVRVNSRYSLRGFAGFLGLNPAELSQVFKGSRNLSLTSAHKVVNAFGFNNEEARYFLWLLQRDKGKQFGLDLSFVETKQKSQLPEKSFAEISQWYHFAILSLIDTKGFEWSSNYVARRLGLTLSEAGLAMRDLQRLGLIKVESKKAKSTKKSVQIGGQIPSSAIKSYHKQMIQKSIEALENTPLHLREYQSVGLALKEEDLAPLKTELDEFTDKIMGKYHKPEAKSVYQIQISVFPLTKGETKS